MLHARTAIINFFRVCSCCSKKKHISEYYKNPSVKSKCFSYCKECHRILSMQHSWVNKDKYQVSKYRFWKRLGKLGRKKYKRKRLILSYGITPKQFNNMKKRQKGLCAICRRAPFDRWKILHIDHDHVTGKVRGLLCSSCNTTLGKFFHKVSILKRAIGYLLGEKLNYNMSHKGLLK